MANANMATRFRFVPHFVDLQIAFCVRNYRNRGMVEFIDKYFFDIRKANPHIPMKLVFSAKVDAWIMARYNVSDKRKLECRNMTSSQILSVVEYLAGGCVGTGAFVVKPLTPRGLQLLDTEIKYRNPFEVFSKR